MLKYLQFSKRSILLFLFMMSLQGGAQSLPEEEGSRARYEVQIDFKKAYISGICIMLRDEGLIKASIVNEFGVSAFDFTYNPEKRKVKILNVMGKMNRWYIKKVLKRDLREVMTRLPQGQNTYEDKKYNIKYTFKQTLPDPPCEGGGQVRE